MAEQRTYADIDREYAEEKAAAERTASEVRYTQRDLIKAARRGRVSPASALGISSRTEQLLSRSEA